MVFLGSSLTSSVFQVVIDATNPLSEFPHLEVMWEGSTSGGELIQAAFPMSVVFKVPPTHVFLPAPRI
jgi:predicted dinucleotide-binding enzyme